MFKNIVIVFLLLVVVAVAGISIFGLGLLTGVNTTPPSMSTTTIINSTTTNNTTQNPVNTQLNVADMQKYVDPDFGFSFWYPANWSVTATTAVNNNLKNVSIIKKLKIVDGKGNTINLTQANSKTTLITDTGGAGPIGPISYYFDTTKHLWMVKSEQGGTVTNPQYSPADISINSMGGLHLFGGTSRFNTKIIPLSGTNFVIINNDGGMNSDALANTIVALDPAVAVPLSNTEQESIIKAERKAYLGY